MSEKNNLLVSRVCSFSQHVFPSWPLISLNLYWVAKWVFIVACWFCHDTSVVNLCHYMFMILFTFLYGSFKYYFAHVHGQW